MSRPSARPSRAYPAAAFPDPVSHLVDEERRLDFEAEGAHFESRYFLTLTYPAARGRDRRGPGAAGGKPARRQGRPAPSTARRWQEFAPRSAACATSWPVSCRMVAALDDTQTLTYLHACVSTKTHRGRAAPPPAFLDAFLTDDDLQGGLYPRLGGQYLRTLSIRAYPTASSPGILDQLNGLGVSYRWVSRFLPLDKEDARRAITTLRKRWFAKRKGILALLKEALTQEPTALEDPDALQKAGDADAALAILGGDAAAMGYFTPTLTLMDPDPDAWRPRPGWSRA
jgi:type IV secretory pathway VirB4 component